MGKRIGAHTRQKNPKRHDNPLAAPYCHPVILLTATTDNAHCDGRYGDQDITTQE